MKAICAVPTCRKEFEKYDRISKSRKHLLASGGDRNFGVKYKRPVKAVTCSRKCSRIYTRNAWRLSAKRIKKIVAKTISKL